MSTTTLGPRQAAVERLNTPRRLAARRFLRHRAAVAAGAIKVQGAPTLVTTILDLLDIFPANFNIVTPDRSRI